MKTKKIGIYGFRNIINGKWYIGQSIDIRKRRVLHLWALRSRKHRNKHFQDAFLKYGESNFEFHILEETSENMLDVRERAWITYYKSMDRKHGYNMTSGGNKNKRYSKEICLKISKASKKKTFSLETRRKMSESAKIRNARDGNFFAGKPGWNKGKHHSEETKLKIRESNKGKHVFTKEKIIEMSKRRKNWKRTPKGMFIKH